MLASILFRILFDINERKHKHSILLDHYFAVQFLFVDMEGMKYKLGEESNECTVSSNRRLNDNVNAFYSPFNY